VVWERRLKEGEMGAERLDEEGGGGMRRREMNGMNDGEERDRERQRVVEIEKGNGGSEGRKAGSLGNRNK
jgi:hypothetical protein